MIKNRNFQLIAAIATVAIFTNVVSFTTENAGFSQSYSAVVCPAVSSGESSLISLTSTKVPVRRSGVSTLEFKAAGNSRLAGGAQAIVVDSQAITPISWQARSGVWAGAVTCLAPITSQWFVGGSADVTSKGTLTLVNSGLGRALIGVTVYTENGAQAEQSIAVKANSLRKVPLSSLAPGSRALAIKILPQTGRVNAFLIDERGRGLRALGGDSVNSMMEPARSLTIPAIPRIPGQSDSQVHILRILVPGDVGAELKAVVSSADESFSPAGVDGKFIAPGKVIEIPLTVLTSSPRFALTLNADRPILAAVYSRTLNNGKSDFLWSTPTPELKMSSFSVTGTTPLLVFTGEEISVDLEISAPQRAPFKVEIRGEGLASYQMGEKARTVKILRTSKETFGAALINSPSGSGYAPLTIGTALIRSSIPQSDIRVLVP